MEGNETIEAKTFDQSADNFLNTLDNSDSSAEEVVKDGKADNSKPATAEVEKTEQVKNVEADTSLSVEEKIAKVKEILGEDEKAIDAYIKSKGYHKDPAWQKQREIIEKLKQENASKTILSSEDKKALEDFKQVTSSADYIRASMKAKGYTEEAIDNELKNRGIKIPEKSQDDIALIANKLGIDTANLNENQKYMLEDITKVVNILLQDRLGKILPEQLKPIQDHLGNVEQQTNAEKILTTMKNTVKSEGVLDFEKDIEPELNKFMDENPDAVQADVLAHFSFLNHKLTIERLRTGKRQEERDVKKSNLRQNINASGGKPGTPARTGNFEKDADAFLDSLNFRE